jgi:hypothetical protein
MWLNAAGTDLMPVSVFALAIFITGRGLSLGHI